MPEVNLFDYYEDMPDELKPLADFQINADHADSCWESLLKLFETDTYDTAKRRFQLRETSLRLYVNNKSGVSLSIKQILPNSTYRTAKSVILRAKEHGISLRRDDGTLVGKTYLEKEIKKTVKDKEPPSSINLAPQLIKLVNDARKKWQDDRLYNRWIDDVIAFLESRKVK